MLKLVGKTVNGVSHKQTLSKSITILLYSTATQSDPSSYSYYLINSLGFSEQQSRSTTAKFPQFYKSREVINPSKFVTKANSVVDFFNSIGFETLQVRKIVSFCPRVLFANVDKTLIPKIKLFEDMGFSKSDIYEVILVNPHILFVGFESTILPTILGLREVFGSDDVISFLKLPHLTFLNCLSKYLVKNVGFLRSCGIPLNNIRKSLMKNRSLYARKPENFEDLVVRAKDKFGISYDSGMFLAAVEALSCQKKEYFESKCEVFKKFGWTQDDVLTIFRKNPHCLCLTEARIERSLCFFMKELNYEPGYLASHPLLLASSLEKRILPRHRVWMILEEKCLVKDDYTLNSALMLSESAFLKKFVLPFENVHEVYCKNIGCSVETLSATTAE